MKFSEDTQATHNNISRYGKGFVQIKEKLINTSVIVETETVVADWRPQTLSEMTVEDCKLLIKSKPDVIILGTGEHQQFPEREILKLFAQNQVGLEVMNTAAACRTFNILLSEDRSVVAGLFMI